MQFFFFSVCQIDKCKYHRYGFADKETPDQTDQTGIQPALADHFFDTRPMPQPPERCLSR